MRFFGKACARLIAFFGNVGAGSPPVLFRPDPASGLSDKISEAPGKTPEHDGQWLIGLGAKTQTDIPLPGRDGDRSPLA